MYYRIEGIDLGQNNSFGRLFVGCSDPNNNYHGDYLMYPLITTTSSQTYGNQIAMKFD